MISDDGEDLIDKVFYFENLEKELKEYFEIDSKFPHLNKSTVGDYRNFYNDSTRDIVYNRLKDDFEFLGYRACLT